MLGSGFSISNIAVQSNRSTPLFTLGLSGPVLPSGVLLERSSVGTVYGASKVIVTVAANQPRFDHDAFSGQERGLLVEPQGINLLNTHDVSSFSIGSTTTVTFQPAEIGPDGASGSVYRLQQSASSGSYLRFIDFETTETRALSVFVKDAGAQRSQFQLYFNGNRTETRTELLMAESNWKRVSVSATSYGKWGISNGDDDYETDILVAFPQIEEGALATSYILPTLPNTFRAADLPSVTGILGVFDVRVTYDDNSTDVLLEQIISNGWWPDLKRNWVKSIQFYSSGALTGES